MLNENDIQEKMISVLKTGVVLFGLFILLVLLYNSITFRVDETEQAVVTRFSEVTKIVVKEKTPEIVEAMEKSSKLKNVKIIEGKGLHFKVPFIENVIYFSDRLLTYDTDPREVVTQDKKRLILDNFAQWKITNPALFFVSMKNERNAHTRLDDLIYSNLNREIGKTQNSTVISDMTYLEEKLLKLVIEDTSKEIVEYGMEIVDIRIRRTELPPTVSENIFNRMIAERERIANKYRSEGREESQKIKSSALKEATIIEAKAYETAETIKGQGESEALKIYAESYNQDPNFYEFLKALETYKRTLDGETVIVIPAGSKFAQTLFGGY